jgi:hypothetical protein
VPRPRARYARHVDLGVLDLRRAIGSGFRRDEQRFGPVLGARGIGEPIPPERARSAGRYGVRWDLFREPAGAALPQVQHRAPEPSREEVGRPSR